MIVPEVTMLISVIVEVQIPHTETNQSATCSITRATIQQTVSNPRCSSVRLYSI